MSFLLMTLLDHARWTGDFSIQSDFSRARFLSPQFLTQENGLWFKDAYGGRGFIVLNS